MTLRTPLSSNRRPAPLPAGVLLCIAVLLAVFATVNSGAPVKLSQFARAAWLLQGVNQVEKSPFGDYRWSNGAALLCVEALGTLPRTVLDVTVLGDYTAGVGVSTFSLTAGNAAPLTVATPAGVRRYQLLSGTEYHSAGRICLAVTSAALRDPNNPRDLGVALGAYRVTPLSTGLILPALPVVVVTLAYAFAAAGLLQTVGVPRSAATAAVIAAIALITAALIGGHVPAGPTALRWALPTLLAGLLTLGAVGLLSRPPLARWAQSWPVPALGWLIILLATHAALQWVSGHRGVWPLKAQFFPQPAWGLLPLLLPYGALLVLAARRLTEPPRLRWIVLVTYAATLSLVLAMELVAAGPAGLTALFRDSPYEYIRDVGRVGDDPLGFLRNFEALAPDLALHASTHPPGAVLFFWLIERAFGPDVWIASLLTVLLSSTAPLAAIWLAAELGSRRHALAAGVIAATMPGLLTYAVPSLDGVMNALLAFGAAAFLLALRAPQRWWYALISGALLTSALALTYAATQIFFFGVGAVLVIGYQLRRDGAAWPALLRWLLRQALPAALVIVAAGLLTWLISGFNVIHAATTATRINAEMMDRFREVGMPALPFGPPSLDWYLRFAAANLTPFAWYVTPWLLAVLSLQLVTARARRWTTAVDSLLAATAALVLGLWLGGLFNREVERIWAFVYPLIAAVAAWYVVEQRRPARDLLWLAGLGLAAAAGVKALLNTFW